VIPTPQKFTVADFERLGQCNDFSYRLPDLRGGLDAPPFLCIAEGSVQSLLVRDGLNLVLSDITVHTPYEATSMHAAQLCAIVMLQGQARTEIKHCGQTHWIANSGMSALYSDAAPMTGYHPAGQRLQSVNLSLSDPEATGDERLADGFDHAMRRRSVGLRRWPTPAFLTLSLAHLLQSPWDAPMHRLLAEGVALQLLAHALGALAQVIEPPTAALSARDMQRLERVREHLHDAPQEAHTLAQLARLACMSPSALRAKFQAAYHCSVFTYLRARRLEVACAKLAQGDSVQQAAHVAGYRHASNFATAFRQRYGIAPSALPHARRRQAFI